jgi:rhamnose utilization protein RhaD (predicted bifunctional aldolase and dehydrogenase)
LVSINKNKIKIKGVIKMEKQTILEAIDVLINMTKENLLLKEDRDLLDETIEYIAENDEELNERHMTSAEKMRAKKWRLKNKARLKKIAKLKASCRKKIKEKEGWACDSKGHAHPVDKKRSKLMKKVAKTRRD